MEDLSCPETTTLSAAELINVLQRVTGGLSVSTKPQGNLPNGGGIGFLIRCKFRARFLSWKSGTA